MTFFPMDGVYAETVYGTPAAAFRDIFWDPDGAPPEGTHTYRVWQATPLFGRWVYDLDGLYFHSFASAAWINTTGTFAQWGTELLNMEDKMVGTQQSKCEFYDLRVSLNWSTDVSASLLPANVYFKPATPGSLEWGFEWLSSTAFRVWDKFP
ncbi:MAG: hypothetical protein V1790_07245 [Planctomycetota bacterium]